MTDVQLINIARIHRGGVHALRDVSLSVNAGELLALVGPSGSGKSTLLRVIAGLEAPTSGEVRIGGIPMNGVAAHQRGVAMVPQNYSLYPHMTVERNLTFGMAARSRQDSRERARAAAAALGIGGLLARYPGELSGGERQRAALAKAMAREPRVFLFDEPLSNLDAPLRLAARREIKALHERLRATMIHVTHDQEEAMSLGERIAVMHGGRIQQVGTPEEVYGRPRNVLVAGFIGTPPMNFLPGRIVERAGKVGFIEAAEEGTTAHLALGAEAGERLRGMIGREVVAGVRPQSLRLGGADPLEAGLSGIVRLVEPLGEWIDVTAELRSGRRVVARVASRAGLLPGAAAALESAGDIHVFEAGEAGRNLLYRD
jgi:multiple sugar transport system ATP-binding protein